MDRRTVLKGLFSTALLPVIPVALPEKAAAGTLQVTGTLTCYFDNHNLYEQMVCQMANSNILMQELMPPHHENCRCVMVQDEIIVDQSCWHE